MSYLEEVNDPNDKGSVNPWISNRASCTKHTAGDWYHMMLTASIGGKPIHGCNTSPTVEVLCKAPDYADSDTGIGYIKWDPSILQRPIIGDDLSDQFYTHHMYRGTITSSGNILAYESGLWEPSIRSRAKSTSLLAAGIHAHGCAISDAVKTVSIIASDDVDEEAVSSAILPASHLKREMTIVSKATHRIFTRGTLQSSIEWDDTFLSLGQYAQSVAFDWGRVTAIARYIAEANIQTCTHFRNYARKRGVPYFIVRNSWAYVSPFDYHLDPKIFASVPKIDIGSYGIPSIKGAFKDHEDEVIIAITRSLDNRSLVPDSDTFESYTNLYKAAKERKARKKPMKDVSVNEYLDRPAKAHSITRDNVIELLDEAMIPYDALSGAIATRKERDPKVRAIIMKYLDSVAHGSESLDLLDEMSKVILDKGTWLLARAIGEFKVREATNLGLTNVSEITVNLLLGRLKSSIFGFQTHVNTDTPFSNKILIELRPHSRNLVKSNTTAPKICNISQMSLAGAEMRETAAGLADLANRAEEILPIINTVTSNIFESWGKACRRSYNSSSVQAEANMFITAYALKNLEVSDCMNQGTGFIDGAAPRKSYVYRGVAGLAESHGAIVPKLKRGLYSNAIQIASELDNSGLIPYNVVEVVKFATNIISNVVGDIFLGSVYEPSDRIYIDTGINHFPPVSPSYGASDMDEQEDIDMIQGFLNTMETERETGEIDYYNQALNSYPSAEMAERYARISGYKCFRDAYDALKEDAHYLEGSGYIINARALSANVEPNPESSSRKRGYDAII